MRKVNEENERVKRRYLEYLREAKGQDEASLDKVAAALLDFETALGFKSFKAFHRDWAARYKKHLEGRRNARTGKPLGLATKDSTLRLVKGLFDWLASQPGYKSRITYADVSYFNNTAKNARAARSTLSGRHPSLEQCAHAFRQMPGETPIDRRDRAIFACLMLTGARAGAIASLRLGHVDVEAGRVFQDGREVRTKFSKSFETWFFPVDAMYRDCVVQWIAYLRQERHFGPTDAVIPKTRVGTQDGRFACIGFSRDPYSSSQQINAAFKSAFTRVGCHPFTPHSIRTTLSLWGDKICTSMEQRKAWSQNLGHDHLATTVSAYMPVPPERQAELIRAFDGDDG